MAPVAFNSQAGTGQFRYISEFDAKRCEASGLNIMNPAECKFWSQPINLPKNKNMKLGNYRVLSQIDGASPCLTGLEVQHADNGHAASETLGPCER